MNEFPVIDCGYTSCDMCVHSLIKVQNFSKYS